MLTKDFSYSLPDSLIAQYPTSERGTSRMLVLAKDHKIFDKKFKDIIGYFNSNDLLVLNDTRVIPARLLLQKESGGKVELILERILDSKKDLRRNALIKKINNDLEKEVGLNNDEFYLTGILILYNNMLQSLFDSQIMSLGFVMLAITVMFLVLFQSILLAIIGIIPNLLAATFVLGLMGLLNLPLDMMTITIAAITIGIAVDNSIHYIYRFREEYINSNDYQNALINSHDSIGRAIFFTGITIIFGFSILILSNFIPTILFGLFTGLAMLVALLAVLTLLPKLIISIRPFS